MKIAITLLVLFFALSACEAGNYDTGSSKSSTSKLPSGKECTTLACKSIKRRYQYLDDANKYGYFYGFVNGIDHPVVEYVVQGSVFPVDDMINPPHYQEACVSGGVQCSVVLDQQQPDQTYGTNGSARFGFLADGNYFEWDGPYAYSQEPLTFEGVKVIGCKAGIPGC